MDKKAQHSFRKKRYLVLEIIPPIRPSLLDASFLLDDGALNDRTQNTESHCDSVIVVAVDAGTFLQLRHRLSVDFESIVQLSGFDTKFGYETGLVGLSNPDGNSHT